MGRLNPSTPPMTDKNGEIIRIQCIICGEWTPKRTHAIQKYCPECSAMMDRKRKKRWGNDNPPSELLAKQRATRRNSRILERGQLISKFEREEGITNWLNSVDTTAPNNIQVLMPFNYSLSKNHVWSGKSKGHQELRREQLAAKEELATLITKESARKGIEWVDGKVWIDLFIQKPDRRGDAVNMLDKIADTVKHVIGVDDKWFGIRRLDWQLIKDGGFIGLALSQYNTEPVKACSSCGRVRPLECFPNNRKDTHQKHSVCSDCLRVSVPIEEICKHYTTKNIPLGI